MTVLTEPGNPFCGGPPLHDYHTHTFASPDAYHGGAEMAKAAARHGIAELALTDHCECKGGARGAEFLYGRAQSLNEYRRAKAFSESSGLCIKVLYGVEIGQPLGNPAAAREIAENGNYDIVLASVHKLSDTPDFSAIDYRRSDPEQIFRRSLLELINTAELGGFDALCHITYPLRYINGVWGCKIDTESYAPLLDELFSLMIRKNIALEINASGLRQKIAETMPGKAVLERYRRRGGELIIFGSDAHRTEHAGQGIAEAVRMAADCGFKCAAGYEKRRLEVYPLV